MTLEEQKIFRNDHIVYRASILQAGINFIEGKFNNLNQGVQNACFVASAVMVRVFIEFFGLHVINKSTSPLLNEKNSIRGSDVTADMVNGKRILLNELTTEENDFLVKAYLTGDRAAAHFTNYSGKGEYGGEVMPIYYAAKFLLIKLDEKIFQPNNEEFTTLWKSKQKN